MLRLLLALGLLCALPAAGQELTGTLKKIKDSRAVVIGYRESSFPFSYLNAAKRPIGYSIDLCLEIVEEAKDALGIDDLAAKYVAVSPDNRIDMVATGKVDLECCSTDSSPDRAARRSSRWSANSCRTTPTASCTARTTPTSTPW